MTIRITKEEFFLLMKMYEQGLQMTILKKYENIDIPKEYNIDGYINLKGKINYQANIQKIPEVDLKNISEDFIEIINKFNRSEEEKEDLIKLYINEMSQNEIWMKNIIKQISEIIEEED